MRWVLIAVVPFRKALCLGDGIILSGGRSRVRGIRGDLILEGTFMCLRVYTYGLVVIAAAVAAASVQACTIRDDVPDSSYLARWAQDPNYASVGKLVVGGSYNGSGVLIAPNWVSTAAHMFLYHGASTAFTIGGNTYTGDAVYSDPNWNGNALHGYDIGLIHL